MNEHNHDDEDHGDHFEGFTLEELEGNFDSLTQELKEGGNSLKELVKQSEQPEETPPYYRGYNPSIDDFLARATSKDECVEIIEYCLKTGEINQNEAEDYLDRLEKGGPRAFGTRKPGYYDKKL